MKLSRLLDGPSKIITTLGNVIAFERIAPRYVERDLRCVEIRARSINTTRKFLFPWRRSICLEAWEVEAAIRVKGGPTYVCNKVLNMNFDRAVDMVVLEVQKQATLHRLSQVQEQLAAYQ